MAVSRESDGGWHRGVPLHRYGATLPQFPPVCRGGGTSCYDRFGPQGRLRAQLCHLPSLWPLPSHFCSPGLLFPPL